MSKIKNLKQELKSNKLDYLLIPIRDEFGCEYVPKQSRRIEFLTGFKGSNAFVIFSRKGKSAFFTDGRYTLQARKEINNSDFNIFEMAETSPEKWLEENISTNDKVAVNIELISVDNFKNFNNILAKRNVELIEVSNDFIDKIWNNRPKAKYSEHFNISNDNKISKLTNKLNCDYILETDPENICWLLNIRGRDLDFTPIILCFAVISKGGEIVIFTDNPNMINCGYEIKTLDKLEPYISSLKDKSIQFDPKKTTHKYLRIIENYNIKFEKIESPVNALKAIKTNKEIENIKQAHITDGIALCRFYKWLEEELNNGIYYTEFNLSEQLSEFRKKHESFYSLSFDAIVGYKDNGAVIHYRPENLESTTISKSGMLLIDSGAQYFGKNICGTTDVTRTTYIGEPSTENKKANTLVLKGHIAIASTIFKEGTSGNELDILARKFLLAEGLDYKHGTGHGVGYFLNVHEGPHGINKINKIPLKEGMIISNEPGFYKEGEYGIRIERLVYVKKSHKKGYLELETLTTAPIETKLIDLELLSEDETTWVNEYHKRIYEELSQYLTDEEKYWLRNKTKSI